MQIIDYTILTDNTSHSLGRAIRQKIKSGWAIKGELVINSAQYASDTRYNQVMVKYKEKPADELQNG
jgi:hypothetical protein